MRYKSHVRRVLRVFKCSALACNPSFLGHRVMTSNSLPSPDSVLHRESELWGGKSGAPALLLMVHVRGIGNTPAPEGTNHTRRKCIPNERTSSGALVRAASEAVMAEKPCASRDGSRLLQARVCTPVEFMSPAARYTVAR
jgi:hypothetical protein